MIASSSRSGRRADTGCAVAPSFQHAIVVATNSTEFGSAIVTTVVLPTPCAASAWATRFASRSSSPARDRSPFVGDRQMIGLSGGVFVQALRVRNQGTVVILARRRSAAQPT